MNQPRETTIIRQYEERLRAQAGTMADAHKRILDLQRQLADVTREREEVAARNAVLEKNHAVLLTHYHAAAQLHAEDHLDFQRQLADVTRERDTLRSMLELQNAKLDRVAAVIERSGK